MTAFIWHAKDTMIFGRDVSFITQKNINTRFFAVILRPKS
jgi:hypothetical protein